jgi:hypothetical protein
VLADLVGLVGRDTEHAQQVRGDLVATDVLRLAEATGRTVDKLPESLGGGTVDLVDPRNAQVRGVSDIHELSALPA